MNGARLSEHSCCSFAVRCHSRRRTGGGTQLGLLKQAGQRSTNFMLLQSIRPLLFAQALRRTLHHSRRECCRTPTAATAPLARAAQAERQLSNTPLIDFRSATCLKTHYEPRHRCCRGHAGQRLSCRRAAALCRRPHRGQTLHLMQIGFRAASTLPTVLSGLFYLGLEARKGGVRRPRLLFAPLPRPAVTLLDRWTKTCDAALRRPHGHRCGRERSGPPLQQPTGSAMHRFRLVWPLSCL